MRQIHQVIDHQAEIAFDVIEAPAVRPFRTFRPMQMLDLAGVREHRITGPHPNEPVALDHRKRSDRGKRANALTGHRDGFPVAPHDESVISANELTFDDATERQRSAAMRTEVLYRCDQPFGAPIENNALVADLPPQRLVIDLAGSARDVPGVLRVHEDSPRLLFDAADPQAARPAGLCRSGLHGHVDQVL